MTKWTEEELARVMHENNLRIIGGTGGKKASGTNPVPYRHETLKAEAKMPGTRNTEEEDLQRARGVYLSSYKKPNKHNAVASEFNGRVYPSKKAAAHAQEDVLRIKAGDIDFTLEEVSFRIPGGAKHRLDCVHFKRVGDFWKIHWVEVKGRDLPLGRLKRRQVEEIYQIHIEVV
jgi:hypothetical protein